MLLAQAGMSPAYCLARFEELGARGGIDGGQTLTHRLAETDAQHFTLRLAVGYSAFGDLFRSRQGLFEITPVKK